MERIETYRDHAGGHRWRWLAANNRVMADSGEDYENESDMIEAARHVRGEGGPPIVDAEGKPIDELEESIVVARQRQEEGGKGAPSEG